MRDLKGKFYLFIFKIKYLIWKTFGEDKFEESDLGNKLIYLGRI